jgi:hypothetical protein
MSLAIGTVKHWILSTILFLYLIQSIHFINNWGRE